MTRPKLSEKREGNKEGQTRTAEYTCVCVCVENTLPRKGRVKPSKYGRGKGNARARRHNAIAGASQANIQRKIKTHKR